MPIEIVHQSLVRPNTVFGNVEKTAFFGVNAPTILLMIAGLLLQSLTLAIFGIIWGAIATGVVIYGSNRGGTYFLIHFAHSRSLPKTFAPRDGLRGVGAEHRS